MSLFKFSADNVDVPLHIAQIKEFKQLLELGDSNIYAAYVYHMCDWESPYATEDEDTRRTKVHEEILNPDELIKQERDIVLAAMDKYEQLSETDAIRLLKSARKSVRRLRDYFEEVDPINEKNPGSEAKNLLSNLKEVGTLIKNLNEWEEQVKRGKQVSNTRRGVEIDEKLNT